jgi:LysM repeat protein
VYLNVDDPSFLNAAISRMNLAADHLISPFVPGRSTNLGIPLRDENLQGWLEIVFSFGRWKERATVFAGNLLNEISHQGRRKELNTVADLEQLKQKYAGAISQIESFSDLGASLQKVDLDGEKLHVKGSVPSRVVLERVWDEIKKADPTYADLHHEIANVGGNEQAYTINSGDSLSHIAKRFYGEANKYTEIAKANGINDPNSIQAGQEVKLPVLT